MKKSAETNTALLNNYTPIKILKNLKKTNQKNWAYLDCTLKHKK